MVIEIESTDDDRRLEEIAKKVAMAIMHRDFALLTQSLVEFAEEIKRQSIEP